MFEILFPLILILPMFASPGVVILPFSSTVKLSLLADKVPVKTGLYESNLLAILFVTVVEKSSSLFNASANSFRVSKAAGAPSTRLAIHDFTNAVVAIWVELSVSNAVGALGVPDKTGEAKSAFNSKADCIEFSVHKAVELGLVVLISSTMLFTVVSPFSSLIPPEDAVRAETEVPISEVHFNIMSPPTLSISKELFVCPGLYILVE